MKKFEGVFRIYHIKNFLPTPFVDNEVAGLERLEVLGHRRLGKLDDARQLVHRLSPLEQRLDDAVPRGIADSFTELIYFLAEIRHI